MALNKHTIRFTFRQFPLLIIGLFMGCVDSFDTQSIDYQDQLVVNGVLTNETKQHQVTIGRVAMINDPEFIAEQGATVTISDDHGTQISLTEFSPGVYKTPFFAGIIGNKYQLHFTVTSGRSYQSKPIELKAAPAIDKIFAVYPSFSGKDRGIQLYLNSANGSKTTGHYRWEYEDTYEIRTPYPSKFVWLGGNSLTFRTQAVDRCWATNRSNNIYLQSTSGQTRDQVVALPIKFIPDISQEMAFKYSILVKQYAVSDASYEYWRQMRDLNEKQGSLYDKQPGSIQGNISPLSGDENIVGYFDVSGVSTRRAFFEPVDFENAGYSPPVYLASCTESAPLEAPIEKLGELMSSNVLIIYDATGPGPSTVFLLRKACCDCTSQGTNITPDFWQ